MPYRGPKLLTSFIIPALNEGRYGEVMRWENKEQRIFRLKWVHKSCARWRPEDAAVFQDWDKLKKKFHPSKRSYFCQAKQRFRAALHKLPDLHELDPIYKDQRKTTVRYRIHLRVDIDLMGPPLYHPPASKSFFQDVTMIDLLGPDAPPPDSSPNPDSGFGTDTAMSPLKLENKYALYMAAATHAQVQTDVSFGPDEDVTFSVRRQRADVDSRLDVPSQGCWKDGRPDPDVDCEDVDISMEIVNVDGEDVNDGYKDPYFIKRDVNVSNKDSYVSSKKDGYVSNKKDAYVSNKKDAYVSNKKDFYVSNKKDFYFSNKKDAYVSIKKEILPRSKKDVFPIIEKDVSSNKMEVLLNDKAGFRELKVDNVRTAKSRVNVLFSTDHKPATSRFEKSEKKDVIASIFGRGRAKKESVLFARKDEAMDIGERPDTGIGASPTGARAMSVIPAEVEADHPYSVQQALDVGGDLSTEDADQWYTDEDVQFLYGIAPLTPKYDILIKEEPMGYEDVQSLVIPFEDNLLDIKKEEENTYLDNLINSEVCHFFAGMRHGLDIASAVDSTNDI